MNRAIICTIACFVSLSFLSAQQLPVQWIRSFKGQGMASDRIAAITSDVSGNVYAAGYAGNHHGSPDAFAMKRNAQGDTLWVFYYDGGDNNEDYAVDITVDGAGNTYITGRSQNASHFFDCFTAKILPSGTQDWITRYAAGGTSQSYGNALAVDATGNVYVAGYVDPASAPDDWLVIKYNSSGIQQWADVLNGPGNGDDEALDIAIAPNGNPTVCGSSYSLNASGFINSFVKQYTPSNGTVWTHTWTNPVFTGTDRAFGLGFSSNGDLLVGGETKNSAGFNQDAFAIRYDASGTVLWETIYSDSTTSNDEYLRQVIVDDSGNVFFTGTDYQDAYVTCIYGNGTNGWRRKWKGPLSNGSEVFHGITVDDVGSVYATGRGVYPGPDHYGNGGLTNMIVTKYSPTGDSLWTYRSGDSVNCSMGFSISYMNGKIYAGGFVTDTAYVNENLYTFILDSAGNPVEEWRYNGKGDAITRGQFVVTDAADNIYCAATVDRLYGEGSDIVIVKYDPSGNLLWEKYFSSPGFNNDTLTGMQIDHSGLIVLGISTDSAKLKNNYRMGLLQMDSNGNFTDTTYYNGSGSILAAALSIRNDGAIAIAAKSSVDGGIVVFFNPGMNFSWAAKMDTTQFAATRANSVTFLPSGDLIAAGFSQHSSLDVGLIRRFNSSGTVIWSAVIDSFNVHDEVMDVDVNGNGDIAFTGTSGNASANTTIVGKLNGANGNITWQQVYNPTTAREHGVKVRFAPSGNVAFISRGWTGSVARYYTGLISQAGVFQWANVYSQTASDREPVDLLVDQSNRIVSAGWAINGFTTNYDYVLAGYSEFGTTEFINTYTDTTPVSFSWDQLNDLAVDGQGNFIVTGKSSNEFFNDYLYRMLTIKYGSMPVGINEPVSERSAGIRVYPNPSSDGKFYISNASQDKIIDGKVFDFMGRIIATVDVVASQVDLTGVSSGMYLLVTNKNSSKREHIVLIKE